MNLAASINYTVKFLKKYNLYSFMQRVCFVIISNKIFEYQNQIKLPYKTEDF